MSESTPTEDDLVFAFANDNYFGPEPWRERDARRAVAKIKADALREAAISVTTQVNNTEADEADKAQDPGPYYHGARYGMRKTAQWLHDRADWVEEEA